MTAPDDARAREAAQAMLNHAFRNAGPRAFRDVEFADIVLHFAELAAATRAEGFAAGVEAAGRVARRVANQEMGTAQGDGALAVHTAIRNLKETEHG